MKRQRASLQGVDDEAARRRMGLGLGLGLSGVKADVLGAIEQADGADNVGPVAQDRSAFGGLLGASALEQKEDTLVKSEEMDDEDL